MASEQFDENAMLAKAIFETILDKQGREDHPLVNKLVIYVQAHRAYLRSLSYDQLTKGKINWGLKTM